MLECWLPPYGDIWECSLQDWWAWGRLEPGKPVWSVCKSWPEIVYFREPKQVVPVTAEWRTPWFSTDLMKNNSLNSMEYLKPELPVLLYIYYVHLYFFANDPACVQRCSLTVRTQTDCCNWWSLKCAGLVKPRNTILLISDLFFWTFHCSNSLYIKTFVSHVPDFVLSC